MRVQLSEKMKKELVNYTVYLSFQVGKAVYRDVKNNPEKWEDRVYGTMLYLGNTNF